MRLDQFGSLPLVVLSRFPLGLGKPVALGRQGKFNRIATTAIWPPDVAPGGGAEPESPLGSGERWNA